MKDQYKLFDALLREDLDDKTRQAYLEQINSDPERKVEFQSYQEAFQLANVLERRALKEQIKNLHNNESIQHSKSKDWKKWTTLFLLVVTLLSLLYLFNNKNTPVQPSQTAENYFTPYPDKISSMGENEINLSSYNQKNFRQAISELDNQTGFEANFYKAISHLALKEYDAAQTILETIKDQSPESYKKPIQWYLALTMIGNDNIEDAKVILDAFVNDPNSNYQKQAAEELLNIHK